MFLRYEKAVSNIFIVSKFVRNVNNLENLLSKKTNNPQILVYHISKYDITILNHGYNH